MNAESEAHLQKEDPLEQAAQWFVVLHDREASELSPQELQRWEQWSADPGNCAAFDSLARLWQESEYLERPSFPGGEELAADRFDGEISVARWHSRTVKPTRRLSILAIAATVFAVAVIPAIALRSHWISPHAPDSLEVQETGLGEHREMRLADGTAVTLGARSAVSAQFNAHRRSVVLDRGEALFHVARDASRPFVVFAGQGTITALGTEFNVLRDSDRVVVTVAEGTVEVASRQSARVARLERGEVVSYDAQGERGAVHRTDPELATAWREGRLRYRGESLKHVIDDVNRYSKRQILLDPVAADLEFTGTVFRDQIPQWTRGLERIFPVEAAQADADHVLIRTRAVPPQ